jgi:hypothetical protein
VPGDDAPHDVQAQPRTLTDVLGGVERLKDAISHLVRYSGTAVRDLDDDESFVAKRPYPDPPMPIHGVRCVVNKADPHLIELAAVRLDRRQVLLILARDRETP